MADPQIIITSYSKLPAPSTGYLVFVTIVLVNGTEITNAGGVRMDPSYTPTSGAGAGTPIMVTDEASLKAALQAYANDHQTMANAAATKPTTMQTLPIGQPINATTGAVDPKVNTSPTTSTPTVK